MGLHSNLTCNITELEQSIPYQSRGTGIILSYTMAPWVIGKGADTRGLGRWAWTRLQGKAQTVTILSAYRPCKPSSSGVHTVYEQHARALPILSDAITFLKSNKELCENLQKLISHAISMSKIKNSLAYKRMEENTTEEKRMNGDNN